MVSTESKKALYRGCRARTGLNKRQWGRLFALGDLNNTAQVVGHKENPDPPGPGTTSKGVNMAEALASQLIDFLDQQGYDVANMVFDEQGRLINIPTKQNALPS